MRTIYSILIFAFYSLTVSAQQGIISGIVSDSLTRENIGYASVRLLNQSDSSFVNGGVTNTQGKFKVQALPGKYHIEVSYLGYKTYRKHISTSSAKPDSDIGMVYLINDSLLLDEAVITAKIPDIVVKGDTIEYNADSYTTEEGALLQDIVKKLPGIEMDAEGNLTANGKPIKKILVDGKEFFNNDIKLALQNLPASMIKKLQLFKEQSETSKITGFKDGKEEQVLNLKIKDEYKRNLFGNVQAGYGNNDRYSNRINANYMHNENQFSFIGNMKNVDDDAGSGGYFSSLSGIDKNKNVGANFNVQKSEKFKIGGNLRYSDNSNLFETQDRTDFFNPSRISQQNSSSLSNRRTFSAGTYLEWRPDSLTTIYYRTSASYARNEDKRLSENTSYAEQKDTTTVNSDYRTNGDGYSLGSSIVIGRKLNDKGRNISLSLIGNFRDDDTNGSNNSLTTYSSSELDRTIDQKLDINRINRSWGIGATYVEPLTKKSSLQIAYSYRQSSMSNDRKTLTKAADGSYSVIDKNYSRNSDNLYVNQNINLSFQATHDKYEYTVGFNIDPSYSHSNVSVGDSLIENQKQKVVSFSPSLRFVYKPKDDRSFNFNYNGSTSHPGISQLGGDTIRNSSGTSKTYGNPNLKASFNNVVNFYYQKSDFESGRFLMVSGSFNYTFNQIANYTKVDSLWNTESTYRNVDGNWSTNIGLTYNTPLKNKKLKFDTNTYMYYSRSIGFSNAQKNITGNWSLSESASLSFDSEKINTRLQVNYSYSLTKNNVKDQSDMNVSNIGFNNSTTVKLPFDISIKNDISYTYNSGYSSDFKKSEFLWNASVSKQLLKKKKGTLKIQLFDILKDRSNVTRTVTADYVSDMRTNSISRYFLLSFSYRFNFMPKSKTNSSSTDIYDEYDY